MREGGRREDHPRLIPQKLWFCQKVSASKTPEMRAENGGVAARNREHDLAVEDRVSAEKSLGKEGETVSKRGLSLGSAATFFMRTR